MDDIEAAGVENPPHLMDLRGLFKGIDRSDENLEYFIPSKLEALREPSSAGIKSGHVSFRKLMTKGSQTGWYPKWQRRHHFALTKPGLSFQGNALSPTAADVMGLQAQRGRHLLMMFEVRKINKRPHITEDGRLVYSPPDFMKVPNRAAIIDLANTFNRLGYRCIDAIVAFEDRYSGIKWNRTNFL